jgi:hypothetical protein
MTRRPPRNAFGKSAPHSHLPQLLYAVAHAHCSFPFIPTSHIGCDLKFEGKSEPHWNYLSHKIMSCDNLREVLLEFGLEAEEAAELAEVCQSVETPLDCVPNGIKFLDSGELVGQPEETKAPCVVSLVA